MADSALVIRDGDETHRIVIPHRDWCLLSGPLFNEGPIFISAFGVYDNFTVAGGLPEGSQVTRFRRILYNATRALIAAIEREADLLGYDYSYSLSPRGREYGARSGFIVRGLSGMVSARPHGFCTLTLSKPQSDRPERLAEIIDLRVLGSIVTDDGSILKCHRRKAPMSWLETLPRLLEFLRSARSTELIVEHHDCDRNRAAAKTH